MQLSKYRAKDVARFGTVEKDSWLGDLPWGRDFDVVLDWKQDHWHRLLSSYSEAFPVVLRLLQLGRQAQKAGCLATQPELLRSLNFRPLLFPWCQLAYGEPCCWRHVDLVATVLHLQHETFLC